MVGFCTLYNINDIFKLSILVLKKVGKKSGFVFLCPDRFLIVLVPLQRGEGEQINLLLARPPPYPLLGKEGEFRYKLFLSTA